MRFSFLFCAVASLALGGCYGLYGNDEAQRYSQRSDTITLSAGDAPNVNARTHMIDPWSRGVGDRRIYTEGSRMVRAVDRYKRGQTNTRVPTSGSGGSADPAGGAGASPAGGDKP